jgi:hypothetical protein
MSSRGEVEGVAVGTIAAKNFLPAARVLARSLHERHPEVPFFVVLADEVDGCFDPAAETFTLLPLARLGLPDLRRLCFRYTRHQLAAAAKPWLLTHLLDLGFDGALFLDADVLVTGDLSPLLAAARRHALVLTPHLTRPPRSDDPVARELAILAAGVYNGGCLGCSGSPAARRFLAWAQERLLHHCRNDVAHGLHHDQRWLDLAPGLLDDVCILRDPGCNVAYWNLAERGLEVRDGGEIRAGGQPCRFVHFSGFDAARPQRVTRHARAGVEELGAAARLFAHYARRLEAAGHGEASRWPYAWGAFEHGVRIPDVAREIYDRLGPAAARFGDPFDAASRSSFFRWLQEPVDGRSAARPISRLWEAIYRLRPDVQRALPDPDGKDRREFLQWIRRTGAAEHDIPAELRGARDGRADGVATAASASAR